jgi:hypothetical protein
VGQVIRRKIREDAPIGPYMLVQRVESNRVYAKIIGRNMMPDEMILKKNVYIHKIDAVCISEDMYYRLVTGKTICAQHKATTQWIKVWSSPPELIKFYTQAKNYQAIFVLEHVTKAISLGEPVIRIIVDELIL